uniref:AlNc14C102G6061 protein n=1 Tax=Albugo laibachii Nc14 TaxID=890382 RepID=F0WHM4_9STRA|nr:AlNc14C102G6061 [Albugo laibachii Nc14]|eukprot:CCA20717.1 AlNc14C102G6061 [Albugo laibachii Nc14]
MKEQHVHAKDPVDVESSVSRQRPEEEGIEYYVQVALWLKRYISLRKNSLQQSYHPSRNAFQLRTRMRSARRNIQVLLENESECNAEIPNWNCSSSNTHWIMLGKTFWALSNTAEEMKLLEHVGVYEEKGMKFARYSAGISTPVQRSRTERQKSAF